MPQPTTPRVTRSDGAARPEERIAGAAMAAAPVVARKRRRFMPEADDLTESFFCFIGCLSIHLAEVRWQDVQFGSIFGYSPARDDDALVLQHLDDFLVGEGLGRVFFLEDVGDHVLH